MIKMFKMWKWARSLQPWLSKRIFAAVYHPVHLKPREMIVRMTEAISKETKTHPLEPPPRSPCRKWCKQWAQQTLCAQRGAISPMEEIQGGGKEVGTEVREKRKPKRMTGSGR